MKQLSHIRFPKIGINFFFILMIFVLGACASNKKFSKDANFDASSYVNPDQYKSGTLPSSNHYNHTVYDSVYTPPRMKNRKKILKHFYYPEEASRGDISGVVLVRLYVNAKGNLTNVDTIRSPDEVLTNACRNSMADIQFIAATLHGHPVDSWFKFLCSYTNK